jgi:phosphoribosyl-ATP pyrophosphohydrolase
MDNGSENDSGPVDAASTTTRVPASGSGGGDQLGAVLTELAALIQTRHREMPEGSYTTHLFESGSQKIRKKVGEEAAEILLAHGEELVSEAADFLYHLLVLLEAEDITLDQIAAELRTR